MLKFICSGKRSNYEIVKDRENFITNTVLRFFSVALNTALLFLCIFPHSATFGPKVKLDTEVTQPPPQVNLNCSAEPHCEH